jgi:hypothetical protein
VNLGRRGIPGSLRRLFYADWPMTDAHRDAITHRADRWLDLRSPNAPTSLDATTMRATLAHLAKGPVRTRPYLNSTPWGGQWAARELGFTPENGNTALGYELIAPESGVLIGQSEVDFELPFQLLCVLHANDFLGAEVQARVRHVVPYPLRLPRHLRRWQPLLAPASPRRVHAGPLRGPYTQHESYYVTASPGADARVYLGLREDPPAPAT